MYVAMTRARKHLTLLFATTRFRYGSVDFCTPSRFLKEIDSSYLSMAGGSLPGTDSGQQFKPKPVSEPKPERKPWDHGKFQKVTESMLKDTAPGQSSDLKVGNVIEHERFGIGTVLSVEGSGDSAKARIKFLNVGEKTLLLKFARYKVLK